MQTDRIVHEPSTVKDALCSHFGLSSGSRLSAHHQRFRFVRGHQSRYYVFTLQSGTVRRRAFGKIASNNDQEYRALRYLLDVVPDEGRRFCRPIALLRQGDQSLLITEYLEGYSHPFSPANSLKLASNRSLNIATVTKHIIDQLYDMQRCQALVYSTVTRDDIATTPGQPTPTSVFDQLEAIESLSSDTKALLRSRIVSIVTGNIAARRGIVHGALGMRNVMTNGDRVAFIDWEFMQRQALAVYDACYIATMALMKGVQFGVSSSQLDALCDSLFHYIAGQEEQLARLDDRRSSSNVIWLCRCLAMVDTLWAYEHSRGGMMKELIGQRRRQGRYLAHRISRDAMNGEHYSDASRLWQSSWDTYIRVSKRRSSSATVTADRLIETAGIRPGSRVLDLGCGHGRITELLVDKVPGLQIVGVDMTQELLDNFIVQAGTNGSTIELIRGDITALPFDADGFDAVISSRAFQYLPDPLPGMREALRVVKPGGRVAIVIPNKLNVVKALRYTQRLYSPFEVRDWFEACGFVGIEYGSMGFFPSSRRWQRLAKALELASKIPLVGYLGGNVLVTGRKDVREA